MSLSLMWGFLFLSFRSFVLLLCHHSITYMSLHKVYSISPFWILLEVEYISSWWNSAANLERVADGRVAIVTEVDAAFVFNGTVRLPNWDNMNLFRLPNWDNMNLCSPSIRYFIYESVNLLPNTHYTVSFVFLISCIY